jgi:hypothetical protein
MTDACASSSASAEVRAALPQHGGLAAIDGGSNATTAVSVGSSSSGGGGSSDGGGSSGSEGSGASGTARAAPRGAPCILFFDSVLKNVNKVLFTHLRAFLEFYWARQFESRHVEGYPRSGRPLADEPLPPPNKPPCVPPPQAPKRPKRARAASSSDQSWEGKGEACGEDEDEPDALYDPTVDVASAAGAASAFDADTNDDGDAAGGGGGGGGGSGGGVGVRAAAAAAATRRRALKQTWFSTERMPNIILKKVPQQKNDYDCGLFMLSSIEHLAATEELPSFETADGLIAHFSGATLPEQKAIDEKRANFYKGLFKLAKAQSQPNDPIVHSDWDGEELRPSKRQRGRPAGADDDAPTSAPSAEE